METYIVRQPILNDKQTVVAYELLYKENGFQKKEDAQKLIEELSMQNPLIPHVLKMA